METQNGGYTKFGYDANHMRYKRIEHNPTSGSILTTHYLDKSYEKDLVTGTQRYFIMANNRVVAIYTDESFNSNESLTDGSSTRYLHYDSLGSVDTITNNVGVVIERSAYNVFGKRLLLDENGHKADESYQAFTKRGYTGHEHIENSSYIHMNGRVYDSDIGRFLSADPLIQAPFNTQSFNRYS